MGDAKAINKMIIDYGLAYFDFLEKWFAILFPAVIFELCFWQEYDEKKRTGPGPLPVPGSLHHLDKLSSVPSNLNASFLKETKKIKES